jgi:hypothetical protein
MAHGDVEAFNYKGMIYALLLGVVCLISFLFILVFIIFHLGVF